MLSLTTKMKRIYVYVCIKKNVSNKNVCLLKYYEEPNHKYLYFIYINFAQIFDCNP